MGLSMGRVEERTLRTIYSSMFFRVPPRCRRSLSHPRWFLSEMRSPDNLSISYNGRHLLSGLEPTSPRSTRLDDVCSLIHSVGQCRSSRHLSFGLEPVKVGVMSESTSRGSTH